MNAEQTYLVRRSDSEERGYRPYELTFLWRSGELPRDAEFRDARGEWRPVRELVEPLLAEASAEQSPKAIPASARVRQTVWWIAAGLVVLAVVLAMWPAGQQRDDASRSAGSEERQKLEHERRARAEDVIRSTEIVPGMVPQEVRRTIGPPRAVNATGDGSVQRWIYRRQVVVFENGKVIGVEVPE